MVRINLVLLLVAVICALAAVSSSHRARKLFIGLENEQKRMRDLDVEWSQLQLEQSTWANHARVEKIARDKLAMHAPAAGRIVSVEKP
ncbi:MAG: cell division protein FtsL [Gammaproteobacteria bacterium]|nr:cell division protein FtsL [Gammaproteobacteria bacterium]MBU1645953.1 cell division protein FtsL [Gammaproteobacteria bacterium]MBU1972015.1 cell division protein FtsL [Gammaproteobacteria bacterium]